MDLAKIISNFETTLAIKISATDNSLTLSTSTDDEGNTLSGQYILTIDEGTNNVEHMLVTLTGSSGVINTRGLSKADMKTEIADNRKAHSRGASVKITDTILFQIRDILNGDETFPNNPQTLGTGSKLASDDAPVDNEDIANKKYVDDVAVAGSPDATETTKGIIEIATHTEVANKTTNGGTGARLVVPADEVNIPTDDEKAAMAGSEGTPSATNTFLTEDDATTSSTANRLVRADASGKIDDGWINYPNTEVFTAGEDIDGTTNPVAVYVSPDDGKVYKTDASYNDERIHNFVGFVVDNVSTDDDVRVIMDGVIDIPSITLENNIAETLDQSIGSNSCNQNLPTDISNQLFIYFTPQYGNLTKVELNLRNDVATDNTVTVNIYKVNTNDWSVGSSLGTATATVSDTSSSWITFNFTTPISLTIGDVYAVGVYRGNSAQTYLGYNDSAWYYSNGLYGNSRIYNSISSRYEFNYFTSMSIRTYSTLEKNEIGSNIYLSDTAGEYSLTIGTNIFKIGTLLANNKLKIYKNKHLIGTNKNNGYAEVYSGTYGFFPRTAEQIGEFYISPPLGCDKVEIYAVGNYDSDSKPIFNNIVIHKGEKIRFETYDGTNTDIQMVIDWSGKNIEIEQTTDWQVSLYVKFYK